MKYWVELSGMEGVFNNNYYQSHLKHFFYPFFLNIYFSRSKIYLVYVESSLLPIRIYILNLTRVLIYNW